MADKLDVTAEADKVFDIARKCTTQSDIILGEHPIDQCKLLNEALNGIDPTHLKAVASKMQEHNHMFKDYKIPNTYFDQNAEGNVTAITFQQSKGSYSYKTVTWQNSHEQK